MGPPAGLVAPPAGSGASWEGEPCFARRAGRIPLVTRVWFDGTRPVTRVFVVIRRAIEWRRKGRMHDMYYMFQEVRSELRGAFVGASLALGGWHPIQDGDK